MKIDVYAMHILALFTAIAIGGFLSSPRESIEALFKLLKTPMYAVNLYGSTIYLVHASLSIIFHTSLLTIIVLHMPLALVYSAATMGVETPEYLVEFCSTWWFTTTLRTLALLVAASSTALLAIRLLERRLYGVRLDVKVVLVEVLACAVATHALLNHDPAMHVLLATMLGLAAIPLLTHFGLLGYLHRRAWVRI